jgi:EAL domain-containing protein (putative c-di-GMP-specific phosphodiesterase class I)
VLHETGLHPRYLGLEITEGALMRNPELAIRTLHNLKDMGVRVLIDDFGTGHSSLSHLKRLPVDAVKIDRSFVSNVTTNPDDAAIATAIVAMAHSLKLSVIAEGVESAAQLEFLRDIECDEVQGYLISPPLPANELERWAEAHRRPALR